MKKLDEKKWCNYYLPEIFTDKIQRGIRLTKTNQKPGVIPYVSSTGNNNGVDNFIEINKGSRVFSDCISIANSGSVGKTFYQPFKYVPSDHVTSLKQNGISKFIYLFLIALIERQSSNFNFNREINDARIRKMQIMLPVHRKRNPDLKYMEKYVESNQKRMLKKYRVYAIDKVSKLEYKEIPEISEKEWQPVVLSTLGKIEGGKDIYSYERLNGDIPYITSGSKNNAIGYFVSNNNKTLDSGYISFNRNGSIGLAFYHEYQSLLGNDCRKIHINKADNNKYVGLFIALAITMQKESFSYGRKLGTSRANKMRVMLPVDEAGEPDYEYMEQYAKNMMLKKYKQYLAYLKKKLSSRIEMTK